MDYNKFYLKYKMVYDAVERHHFLEKIRMISYSVPINVNCKKQFNTFYYLLQVLPKELYIGCQFIITPPRTPQSVASPTAGLVSLPTSELVSPPRTPQSVASPTTELVSPEHDFEELDIPKEIEDIIIPDYIRIHHLQIEPYLSSIRRSVSWKKIIITNISMHYYNIINNIPFESETYYLFIVGLRNDNPDKSDGHVNLFEVSNNQIINYEPLQSNIIGTNLSFSKSRNEILKLLSDRFGITRHSLINTNHQAVLDTTLLIPTGITRNCGEYIYWYVLARLFDLYPQRLKFSTVRK